MAKDIHKYDLQHAENCGYERGFSYGKRAGFWRGLLVGVVLMMVVSFLLGALF